MTCETWQSVRREITDRLLGIQFVDRSQAEATQEERDRVWDEFYRESPDDIVYLVEAVDHLIGVITSAAEVAVQIRDKRERVSEEERENAISTLAQFLDEQAKNLTEAS